MKARSRVGVVFTILAATLMLLLSASMAWAAVNDYLVRNVVPKGVTVVGHDLSGMTETQARQAIESAVSAPMERPVTVVGKKNTWTLDPKGIVTIDENAMLKDAYSSLRSATLITRVDSQLRGIPLPHDVKPVYSVNTSTISAWVGQTAKQVNRKPIDATRRLVPGYKFKIKKSVYGARVNQTTAVKWIASALSAESALSAADRSVTLPIRPLKPKVVETSFKTAIIVSLNRCRIYLFRGAKLIKSYPCAPGQPAYPTPQGDFFIQSKQMNAPWINPGTAWAASMPAMIPGGPDNPMGDCKIGINHAGVFMHAIPPGEFGSIGTHASHACMRMFPSDVHDLYGRVKIHDPVFIRP